MFKKIEEDGTTCHTAEATLDVLRPVFEDRIISRRADVGVAICHRWTIICEVPSKISVMPTIYALKDNIREAIGEIQLHTIDNVPKNWTDRVGYYKASRGSHLNGFIFHY